LLTEGEVFENEILSRTESTDNPAQKMPEGNSHGENLIGTSQIELVVKLLILRVFDLLANDRGKLYSLPPKSQYAELEYERRAMFAIGPYVFTKAPPFNPKDYSLENVTVSADFVISVWIVAGRIAGVGLAKAAMNRQ
jgi:hypothetical protein